MTSVGQGRDDEVVRGLGALVQAIAFFCCKRKQESDYASDRLSKVTQLGRASVITQFWDSSNKHVPSPATAVAPLMSGPHHKIITD